MKFANAALALLSVGLVPASARTIPVERDQSIISADDNLKIPGDSPLELCPGTHDSDIIHIESVDLVPNPPEAGKDLVIKAVGTVHKTIEEGAYVLLQVKYGLIRLISTKADLCEQVGNVDLKCPIEKGVLSLTKSVSLPAEIPPGKYTVTADAYTVDDEPITCLTATVEFSRGGRALGFLGVEL
ncbi:ML domain-containing protein [Sodiomyces alkalinus F11]|uniref:Phosphatidylglycerol/phosphatidylinositol transfer protein n=1 Tax=Sodiomyces alkalinus (strain CBS 110278 / VKM F-3762 / F11) TaxID=1314773 RepID=A0A3N2Q1G2_SODAK|nr:ML domain-containing protein [Sodiomyces alkalinus F11]ROT40601.1 ML domain-containing protein [Sodiomyces alkalinus F11]